MVWLCSFSHLFHGLFNEQLCISTVWSVFQQNSPSFQSYGTCYMYSTWTHNMLMITWIHKMKYISFKKWFWHKGIISESILSICHGAFITSKYKLASPFFYWLLWSALHVSSFRFPATSYLSKILLAGKRGGEGHQVAGYSSLSSHSRCLCCIPALSITEHIKPLI